MEKLRAILIDDEKNNLDLLSHFVKKYCLDVEVISECLTYRDAFDLLKEVKFKKYKIIFTTAHIENYS